MLDKAHVAQMVAVIILCEPWVMQIQDASGIKSRENKVLV